MSKYLFIQLFAAAQCATVSRFAGGDQDDLDIELLEIDDWNCCGATEYYISGAAYRLMRSTGAIWRWRLISRNSTSTVCCTVQRVLPQSPKPTLYAHRSDLNASVNDAPWRRVVSCDQHGDGASLARHHLSQIGIEAIKRKVVRPLTGLRGAPYYGCMIVRGL